VKVFVIPTNEEGAIAADTYQLAQEMGDNRVDS